MKFLKTQQAVADESFEEIPDMSDYPLEGTTTVEDSDVAHCSPQENLGVSAMSEGSDAEKDSDLNLDHVDKKFRVTANAPSEVSSDLQLSKYWHQRYRLFSKFDEGIKLDKGSFFFFFYSFD